MSGDGAGDGALGGGGQTGANGIGDLGGDTEYVDLDGDAGYDGRGGDAVIIILVSRIIAHTKSCQTAGGSHWRRLIRLSCDGTSQGAIGGARRVQS